MSIAIFCLLSCFVAGKCSFLVFRCHCPSFLCLGSTCSWFSSVIYSALSPVLFLGCACFWFCAVTCTFSSCFLPGMYRHSLTSTERFRPTPFQYFFGILLCVVFLDSKFGMVTHHGQSMNFMGSIYPTQVTWHPQNPNCNSM